MSRHDFADEIAGRGADPARRSHGAGLAVAVASVIASAAAVAGIAAVLALPVAPAKRADRLPIMADACRQPAGGCSAGSEALR